MSNNYNNVKDVGAIIAKMAAGYLEDNLQFVKSIDKEPDSSFGSVNGYKSGATIDINIPAICTTQSDNYDVTSLASEFQETVVPITLDKTETVLVDASSLDLRNELEEEAILAKNSRIVKSAMLTLASKVESRVLELASDAVYNTVGTVGSTIFDTATMLLAKDELNYNLCPMGDRKALLGTAAMSSAVNARKGLSHSSEELRKQYRDGYMFTADGFDFLESQLLNRHTNGNDVAFEVRTTVSTQGSTSLVVEGLTTTTGTVKKGTTFTVAGCYKVHPQTKQTTDQLQKFVVTADVTADGSGYATLTVSPAMYTSAGGGLQNIATFPTDGDAITVLTGGASVSSLQNLVYHPSAFRFLSTKLFQPKSAEYSGVDSSNGVTVNVISFFDGKTRKEFLRFDVLFAFAAPRPEWSARIV